MKKGAGRTKTEARNKLKEIIKDYEDGLAMAAEGYTVKQVVEDWLAYGLNGRDPNTVITRRYLAEGHVIPQLGARKLRELTSEDVDKWLAGVSDEVCKPWP